MLVECVTAQIYLNNHLMVTIHYNSERVIGTNTDTTQPPDVCRIVAFEVYPQRCAIVNSLC